MHSTSTSPAVTCDALTKRFGSRTAVDRLTVTIPAGVVAGLVGPNGAGKTTIMAMLLGLARPSSGHATVLGHDIGDPAGYLGRVGALIEAPAFHGGLSGEANLRLLAALGGHARPGIEALLELVGLADRGADQYRTYSLGMKQRLGIAAALLGDPELVLLDEPSNGVDAEGMREIRGIVTAVADAGRTVIVSSHLLVELEQVCDWLVVVDRGGLVYEGALGEFGATDSGVLLVGAERPADLACIGDLAGSHGIEAVRTGDQLRLTVGRDDPARLAAAVNRFAHGAGITLTELHHHRPDLNDRYLALVAGGDR